MSVRRNFSTAERESIFSRVKNDHLKEKPASLESALVGFHGRSLNYEKYVDLEQIWDSPQDAKCFGIAKVLYYNSDKRDPADPQGEGQQGFNKAFYHTHEGADVLIYELKLEDLPEINTYFTDSQVQKYLKKNDRYCLPEEWPSDAGWLGELKKIEYVDVYKKTQTLLTHDYYLYMLEDMSTLMALPKGDEIDRVLFWCSPDLKVNWRGIIN